jgi:hypothetical protein
MSRGKNKKFEKCIYDENQLTGKLKAGFVDGLTGG